MGRQVRIVPSRPVAMGKSEQHDGNFELPASHDRCVPYNNVQEALSQRSSSISTTLKWQGKVVRVRIVES